MNTILLGYKDAEGASKPKVICGPEVPAATQIRIFQNAKVHHKFPDGLKRLEMCVIQDDRDVAIHISEDVAQTLAQRRKDEETEKAKRTETQKKSETALKQIKEAREAVEAAAKNRNGLMAALEEAKIKLRNAEQANNAMPNELHAAAVAAAKKLIFGDEKEKIPALEEKIKAAKEEYAKAESALSALLNPKPETK